MLGRPLGMSAFYTVFQSLANHGRNQIAMVWFGLVWFGLMVETMVNAMVTTMDKANAQTVVKACAKVFAASFDKIHVYHSLFVSMDLLTVSELADLLKLKRGTLDRWRAAGIGPTWIEVGGQFRYRREDVDAWLAQQTKGAPTNA